MKRMKILYYVVCQDMAFRKFPSLLELVDSLGGLADCPQGNEPASIGSRVASYSSITFVMQALQALAESIHYHFRPHVQAQVSAGYLSDATGTIIEHRSVYACMTHPCCTPALCD